MSIYYTEDSNGTNIGFVQEITCIFHNSTYRNRRSF